MRRSTLLVVCLAVFVDMLGFGIILPILPLHAQNLGGSGAWVGALLTAYAAAQFVAAPVLGSLSDRFGRRRLLLLALAGSAISLALTAVAATLALLLLARLVAGAFGGAIAVGQAYVVDLSDERGRTRALGLVGASVGLGFVVGPGIGAGLTAAGLGFTGVCLTAAAIAAGNLAAGLVLLPPPAAPPSPAPSHESRPTRRLASLGAAVREPGLRPVVAAMFAVTFAFAGMETTFALLGKARFGLGPEGLGLVFTGVGIVMVLVQGGAVGRMTDRYGHRRVAVTGAALLGLGLVVLPYAPAWLAYLALGLVAAGQGLLSPTIAVLITEAGGGGMGGALGVGQSAAAAARAIGPIVAGLAYDRVAAAPYVLGFLLAGAAATLLGPARRCTGGAALVPAGETVRNKQRGHVAA